MIILKKNFNWPIILYNGIAHDRENINNGFSCGQLQSLVEKATSTYLCKMGQTQCRTLVDNIDTAVLHAHIDGKQVTV